ECSMQVLNHASIWRSVRKFGNATVKSFAGVLGQSKFCATETTCAGTGRVKAKNCLGKFLGTCTGKSSEANNFSGPYVESIKINMLRNHIAQTNGYGFIRKDFALTLEQIKPAPKHQFGKLFRCHRADIFTPTRIGSVA